MGNRVKAPVKAIGTYRLILDTGRILGVLETCYVPSLSKNLFSLSKLDKTGYSFNFGNGYFSLFKHNYRICTGTLCDNLYKLNLDNIFDETLLTLHHNIGTKQSLVNEQSAFLWHKRLGHISKERLIKNETLPNLKFTDLKFVWIVLKENKQDTQRKEPQEAHNFLKLCTLIQVVLLILHL